MKVNYFRLGSSTLLLALAAACSPLGQQTAPTPSTSSYADATATRDANLALGNPSGAATDATNYPNNYLLVKSQYTLSYNRDQGKPNWVSWHLSSAWLGSAARQDNFAADASLPSSWYHVGSTSYSGSGFDRGHNCPSADRTGSVADNTATFLMSNMMPQAPTNNQQTWAGLENYCRTLVSAGNELYVIAGSYGKGGTGSNGTATTIDQGRITVPSNCWKVVVVLPVGATDASRITASTRVIAVNMPNSNSISTTWGSYRTTVNAIEAATGYDLLSAVSTTIQASIEGKTDTGPTN
ncbi:DNA/RNA non-specific endonuclease [Hymenobacter sp. UV11]|uniref:DNA/RNA non-specific endonuclease n=1 Tax=Hymenobacter sp. UV11 TaxID=1849735 RepID=UPI00105DD9E4|nr:DNA/RNA non-specific endonuclease [Hymenobacter sp. UV11]TDN37442.1 DNA/RNA endonuclease [Hymenobacter sp. UV11]TFZ68629.1 DNA/RNA non-specific endonuclease [Hymenobacter sp. UV11]